MSTEVWTRLQPRIFQNRLTQMTLGDTVDDGEALRTNIVSTVGPYWHPTSTVPMGTDSDPTAVVCSSAVNCLGVICVSQQPQPESQQRTGEYHERQPWPSDKKDCASSEPVRSHSRARMCVRHGH